MAAYEEPMPEMAPIPIEGSIGSSRRPSVDNNQISPARAGYCCNFAPRDKSETNPQYNDPVVYEAVPSISSHSNHQEYEVTRVMQTSTVLHPIVKETVITTTVTNQPQVSAVSQTMQPILTSAEKVVVGQTEGGVKLLSRSSVHSSNQSLSVSGRANPLCCNPLSCNVRGGTKAQTETYFAEVAQADVAQVDTPEIVPKEAVPEITVLKTTVLHQTSPLPETVVLKSSPITETAVIGDGCVPPMKVTPTYAIGFGQPQTTTTVTVYPTIARGPDITPVADQTVTQTQKTYQASYASETVHAAIPMSPVMATVVDKSTPTVPPMETTEQQQINTGEKLCVTESTSHGSTHLGDIIVHTGGSPTSVSGTRVVTHVSGTQAIVTPASQVTVTESTQAQRMGGQIVVERKIMEQSPIMQTRIVSTRLISDSCKDQAGAERETTVVPSVVVSEAHMVSSGERVVISQPIMSACQLPQESEMIRVVERSNGQVVDERYVLHQQDIPKLPHPAIETVVVQPQVIVSKEGEKSPKKHHRHHRHHPKGQVTAESPLALNVLEVVNPEEKNTETAVVPEIEFSHHSQSHSQDTLGPKKKSRACCNTQHGKGVEPLSAVPEDAATIPQVCDIPGDVVPHISLLPRQYVVEENGVSKVVPTIIHDIPVVMSPVEVHRSVVTVETQDAVIEEKGAEKLESEKLQTKRICC